jgi:hypothetical protein
MKSIPYAGAIAGNRARQETLKILQRFGCEEYGFYDKPGSNEVLLQFKHRGQSVQLHASAAGWAALWLKKNPLSYRSRKSEHEHRQEALRQGHLAVSSMLRDMIKGSMTRIETGMFSFEQEFMPFMLTADGRPLIERLAETDLMPKPDEPKVVSLPRPGG